MDVEELRRVSRLLFGSKHRLEIAAAVAAAPEDSIFGRAVAQRAGVADSQVWGELRRLEEAGLLVRLPRAAGESQVRFRRRASPYWEWIWELAGEVSQPIMTLERQLTAGESQTFEACASLLTPVSAWLRTGRDDGPESDAVAQIVLRKIVGFLNADGGTLLIGAVEEAIFRGHRSALQRLEAFPHVGGFAIVGLMDPTFRRYGWDRWSRRFAELLANQIDPAPSPFVRIRREELAGQTVCDVTIAPAPGADPFFLRERDDLVYYVRSGDRSVPLRGLRMIRHWQERERAARRLPEEQAASRS